MDSISHNQVNRRSYSPSDYHEIAKQRGFEWLGPEVSTVTTKTRWRCERGHEWNAHYSSIKNNGSGCPYCANVAAKTPADYHSLATRRGFTWVGPEARNARTITGWRCGHGHEFSTTYGHIHGGDGCPRCSGKAEKTADDYRALALSRGMTWLGPELVGSKKRTLWRCRCGFEWQATYQTVAKGHNCPQCYRDNMSARFRFPVDEYHKLAAERGFSWLGSEVRNATMKTRWQCAYGHEFETNYNKIQQGAGCPYCLDLVNGARVSSQQRAIGAMVSGQLNYKCGRLSIDVALFYGGVKIAIEYDSWYWHKDKLNKDSTRDERLLEDGWRILRIKSENKIPTDVDVKLAIWKLLAGNTYAEIVLDDWGSRP